MAAGSSVFLVWRSLAVKRVEIGPWLRSLPTATGMQHKTIALLSVCLLSFVFYLDRN